MADQKDVIDKLKDTLDRAEQIKSSWGKVDFQNQPIIAVDAIIEKGLKKYVLIKRKFPPFKGFWALPGGIVKCGETVEAALEREVREETGLSVRIVKLVGVYSGPNRDPRGHVISICYLCEALGGELKAQSDAEEIRVCDVEEISIIHLAFDHLKMFKDANIL